jgi:hypothetical protein
VFYHWKKEKPKEPHISNVRNGGERMDAPIKNDAREGEGSRRRCFVISPIGPYGSETRSHMDIVFHCIIEPALSDRYEVVRGDHVARPGRITEQFVEDIMANDLIVCVLTGNNPNVYYELGIAESAARPMIVLRQRGDNVPFDVSNVRFIEYDLDPRRIYDAYYVKLIQRAEKELSPGDQFDGKVPFAPHLTPLGRNRLNFTATVQYDSVSPQVSEILASAEKRFFFCGLSLRGWIGNEGFLALLDERARAQPRVDCRILLMSPDNPAIGQMLNRGVADQEERIRNDVKTSFELLTRKNLEVRLVRHGIIYQQMAMSERSMIWVPHLYSKQTGQSPAVRVDVGQSNVRESGLENLYTAMSFEFEMLWNESAPTTRQVASASRRRFKLS